MIVPVALAFTLLSAAPHFQEEKALAGPFAAASIAPADVGMYIHVEGAADLRKRLANRPIARWFTSSVESGKVPSAWSKLAKAAGVDEATLFDQLLGRRCTLMIRHEGEWALIAETDDATVKPIIQRLKVRVREPRDGMAIAEVPEQELLLARNGSVMVIGPSKSPALFYETLSRLDEAARPEHKTDDAANADAEPVPPPAYRELARQLGTGRIGVFVRHAPPMGGCSAAVADLNGEQLVIRHAAKFDHAPFTRGITKLTCDYSPVLNFESRSLVALMQPTDVDDGPVETFLTASLGEGLMSKAMRENAGDRRLLVFSEVDGRLPAAGGQPSDLLTTTMTACVQVKDSEHAVEQLDEQMVKVSGRVNALNKGAFLVQTPPVRSMDRCEPREVHLSEAGNAAEWFTGGFPIMQNVSLNWTVADGPSGTWYVIASHRASLDEVVAGLKQRGSADAQFVGQFDNCGVSNGIRLSRHLRSWSDQAAQLAEPGREWDFRVTLQMMSELAGGLQNCRWQLARPSPNEMRLDVQARLAPAESATGE